MSKLVIFLPRIESTVLSVRVSVASAELPNPNPNPADTTAAATNAAILAGRSILADPTLIVVSSMRVAFISRRLGRFDDDRRPALVGAPHHHGILWESQRSRSDGPPCPTRAIQGVESPAGMLTC